VIAGDADVGVGLRETAKRLDCGFVSLGEQSVAVRAAPDRADREAVRELAAALDDPADLLDGLAGYSRNSRNDP
jgi:putative molybdopterin biosynthesis protein